MPRNTSRLPGVLSTRRCQGSWLRDAEQWHLALQVQQVASNFRTLETLQRAQAHLLAILDRRDVPLAKIHHFLWDRFRGGAPGPLRAGLRGQPAPSPSQFLLSTPSVVNRHFICIG